MNPQGLINILSAFFRWSISPQGATTLRTVSMAAKAVPPIIAKVDSWISSANYAQAVRKVQEIERSDTSLIKKVYREYHNQMSPDVKQAFQESLKRRGESIS